MASKKSLRVLSLQDVEAAAELLLDSGAALGEDRGIQALKRLLALVAEPRIANVPCKTSDVEEALGKRSA